MASNKSWRVSTKPPVTFMDYNQIIQGDTLEVLRTMPDECIDCVVTSPPYYDLRDYSVDGQIGLEKTLTEYLDKMLLITNELKRVLKKTGTMWWNHGDSYNGLKVGNTETKKNPKVATNSSKKEKQTTFEKCLLLQAHRLAIRMVDEQNWILRNTIIWHKPNVMPSSVKDRFTVDYEPIFFFVKSKKYWFETQYEPHTYHEERPPGIVRNREYGYQGKYKASNDSWKTAKNKGLDYGGSLTKRYRDKLNEDGSLGNPLGRNKRAVWKIPTKPYREAHFATFPPALIETPIKAGCPEMICKKCGMARKKIIEVSGGTIGKGWNNHSDDRGKGLMQYGENSLGHNQETYQRVEKGYTDCGCNAGWDSGVVLDPFMGSGTTALVARQLGRRYLGIELNPAYIKLAEKRLAQQVLI